MHYEDFKRKPHNWGIPENEIWRRYQLFMEQEMFKQLHLQLLEAKGESSSSSSSASGGGALLVEEQGEIDTLFPNWRTNGLDGSVYLTALNTQIGLNTFDPTAINTFGTFPGSPLTLNGVNAPNGKIYLIPNSGFQVGELDPQI